MKKTAAVIAACLLLAACTTTQNTAEKQPRRPKRTKSRLGQTIRGARTNPTTAACIALREQIRPAF